MKLPHIVEKTTLHAAMAVPPVAFTRVFGPPPVNDRNVALDDHMHVFLSLMAATKHPEIHTLGLDGARQTYDNATTMMDVPAEPDVIRVHMELPGATRSLYARRYTHRHPRTGRPCIVFFHGGGFVVGSVDGYDGLCSMLAHRTGADIVSVEYGLAPEHMFPAGFEDAVVAFRAVREKCAAWGCDPARIAPMGDSAGANLAINVCQRQVLDN